MTTLSIHNYQGQESHLKTSNDNSTARNGSRRQNEKKTMKSTPRRKVTKTKEAHSFSSSLLILESESEYTTSDDNTESESFERDSGSKHRTKQNQSNGLEVMTWLPLAFEGQ